MQAKIVFILLVITYVKQGFIFLEQFRVIDKTTETVTRVLQNRLYINEE